MCECCSAEVDEWSIGPLGWMLCQATSNGNMMAKGQWGLVWSNDPTYIWTPKPMVDPTMLFVTDKDWEAATPAILAESDAFEIPAREFADALKGDIESAHHLYECGLKAGYKHGRFESWLFDYLARWLLANPEPTNKNRMPRNDVGDEFMGVVPT
jgi:hypothetical protein